MFDPHHDRPEGVVPIDGQLERKCLDHMINHCPDLVAVGLDLGDTWPVIVVVIQIVPRHLVNADGKQRLVLGIDALLDDLGDDQFVDVKDRGDPNRKSGDGAAAQRLGRKHYR